MTDLRTNYPTRFTRTSSQSSLAAKAKARLDADPTLARYAHSIEGAAYALRPFDYIRERLGWQPWAKQQEVLDVYTESLRAQLERTDGPPVPNIIRVEAGHTVGKTTLAAGIVSHFFDSFRPSVIYCFAPTYEQINDLLFKEIRKQRQGRNLPGRVLETPEIKDVGDHFVKGRATNNSGGQGTERIQGQHEQYLMFVIDEAEGVADFVFDAIDSMTSGGIAIVLMLANPRTRLSRFHKIAANARAVNIRISCLEHPNVLAGREIIPGAVRRDYVESMIDNGDTRHCEVVNEHNADDHTFELPWRPGVIYKPDPEFCFRVLGIAPANSSVDTFIPSGRYAAAKARPAQPGGATARMGVDMARFGDDRGTLYTYHGNAVRRVASFGQQRTGVYLRAIKDEARSLAAAGVTSLHVRVDGGGGFGSGVIDGLEDDQEYKQLFADFRVFEVHFNATPYDVEAYADLATELYGHTAAVLTSAALVDVPPALEVDLCERKFKWVKAGPADVKRDVKKLESKDDFRKRYHRSPDEGDGCALACAPDYVFPAPDDGFSFSYDVRIR